MILDKKSPVPEYYQVQTDIEEKIKNGYYPKGAQLPTDMAFCEIYNTSRITIRRALQELENAGYVERRQGKGTFVKREDIEQNMSHFYSFTEELKKMGYIPSSIFLSLDLIVPNREVSKALGLKKGEKTYLLERLRLANGNIVAYDRSYIAETVLPGFNKDMITDGSLYQGMKEHYGFAPNNSEETIEAVAISGKDARRMKIAAGTPVLLVKRTSFFKTKPIEFNFRIVNSEVFKYKMKLE
jgi:GntR family transcriptional regulator